MIIPLNVFQCIFPLHQTYVFILIKPYGSTFENMNLHRKILNKNRKTNFISNSNVYVLFSEISQSLSIYPHFLSYTLEFEMKLVFLFLFNIFRCKFMFSNVLPYDLLRSPHDSYVECRQLRGAIIIFFVLQSGIVFSY
jgi:hypothetical protein